MKRLLAGLLIAAPSVFAGCQAAEPPEQGVRDEQPAPDGDGRAGDGSGEPVCLRGDTFVANGDVTVRDATPVDADRIAALRWQAYDGCERLVIDLGGADGSPAARAGAVTAEVLRDLGVVRVALGDVRTVVPDATDATFDGALARAAYAVWSPDARSSYVDVHLAGAAEAYVATLDEPARVVVDLRPGGTALPPAAPRSDRVVVLQPRGGTASYPLTVTGYARTFEANVVVRIEQDGREILKDFTTATAWVDAWGEFSLTIPRGPRGRVVVHVGEYSARDGTWEGVAIELELR